ncbi:hypothetical protein VTN77DRAFT_4006 [Rasamsonia byssochlamydoides]|uniref:uncharacterized protein n=1 Tax=Rasamsonia byssochlamydoides TaxID=89139 RepID=UPI0037444E90
MKNAQIGFNILLGSGISASLALIVATVQFTAPHSHLSTATGLAFSGRAIGGAFGSAVENAIIQGTLYPRWTQEVTQAAMTAGLPASSIPALLQALQKGHGVTTVPGANSTIIASAQSASQGAYAHAYHRAWACLIPLVVLTVAAVSCLKDVKHLMTEKIEASVERGKAERAVD